MISKILPVNFAKGRLAPIDVVVVHIMEGSLSGTDAEFRNPATEKSAHYGVGKNGEVWQWVHDADTAWHAGKIVSATAAIVKERPGKSPNSYSIGIECEGFATEDPSTEQLAALSQLVSDLCASHKIPLDRRHVLGHREIRSDKTCPGKIDVDLVVQTATENAKAARSTQEAVREAVAEIRRQLARIEAMI